MMTRWCPRIYQIALDAKCESRTVMAVMDLLGYEFRSPSTRVTLERIEYEALLVVIKAEHARRCALEPSEKLTLIDGDRERLRKARVTRRLGMVGYSTPVNVPNTSPTPA